MSTSKHSIQSITSADVPTLAEFLLASKLQLAINRFLFKDWPNEPAQRAIYTGAAEGGFNDPDSTSLKVVNDMSGEMVGHLVLTYRKKATQTPAEGDADANQTQQQNVLDGFNPEVLSAVMKMVKEVDMEMRDKEHFRSFEITYIYVQPSSQNQGFGSRLIRLAIDKAKAAGLPLAVASEPQAHKFFRKQGFQERRHFDVDLNLLDNLGAMSHSEFANKGRERPPSLLACITCRKKHLRCDAQMPICGRCAYRKIPCVYLESKRGYRDRKKQSKTIAGALKAGGEDSDEGADHPMDKSGDASTLTTYTWPVAIHDGAIPSIATRSPTESITRGACSDDGQQDKASHYSADLVDAFYSSFFPAHGFVVPRKLLLPYPEIIPGELKAVLRFVGSHFQHTQPQEALREAAFKIIDENVPIDPGFKIQGLLCLAMVFMAGRLERALGMRLLHEAIDIALTIGLHRRKYAANRPADHPILAESWRRTYWDLYVVDTLLSALDGSKYTSRLQDVAADLPLPGHDDDYVNCRLQSPAPTMQEMADRVFAETPFNYSSGAYKVEATRIMRKVLALEADSFNVTNAQVDTIDASIQSFLLSLPSHMREVVESDGKVDEVLFTTHMIIQWASIALHRPRSHLTFLRYNYRTACSSEESVGLPALSFQSHAAKAIRAANAISKLTAIQTAPALHTPCFACVIALSATVHLPAYTTQDNQSEIRERLHLSVSALAAIGEVWPLASIVRAQVAQFARETFKAATLPAGLGTPENMPAISEGSRQEDFDLENMVNDDSWLNELDAFALMRSARGVEQSGWN